jgi:2-hydroxychromene-2-carboxylate isomerase
MPLSSGRVDFYFDVVCPYAYLAHTQIERICRRHGAELLWKPILLGGLFRSVRGDDGPMPTMAASRAKMNLHDMHRWAELWNVPLTMPAEHPRRSVLAMRAIVACEDASRAAKALYRAYWIDGRDVADPEVVRAVLDGAGLDGGKLVARCEEQTIKVHLRSNTDEAASAGAFGVPTFVVHRDGHRPELLWGQDRLQFVEELLQGAESPRPLLSFHYDYSSPFAYLAATQVERIAKKHGARLRWRPFLLGGLFKAIGTPNVPLLEMPASKQRYMQSEMARWAERYDVPFRFPTRFPMNTVAALRMTLQVAPPEMGRLAMPLFRALWVEDRDLNDKHELTAIADSVGFDGAALVAGCEDPAVKKSLHEATSQAVELGVCGAPCFLVQTYANQEGTLFWGQDRLELVEKALDGWRPSGG